jgi:catechol 2,3-dioxygenase-like lactoylglutathione lyase family enzyme
MNRLGLTHLSLRVEDLDETLAAFSKQGVDVLTDTRIDVPEARTKAIFISDPDGTLIELVQQPGD